MAEVRAVANTSVNSAALREVLGARSLWRAVEKKASGRPSVNVAQVWRFFTTSVYKGGDLPVIATREALQNSVDAIRAAVRAGSLKKGQGRFACRIHSEKSLSISWEDNGIGMDETAILQKFLSLGDSGKQGLTEAAGGFGVAKAVILGTSETFRWEMLTRNSRVVSTGPAAEVEIFDAPMRSGTLIQIFDVAARFMAQHDWVSGTDLALYERIGRVLGACDLPDIGLWLNGAPVKPFFGARGAPMFASGNWGAGTNVKVRAFRRPPGDLRGAFYVRLNGLFQFVEVSNSRLPADIVVDLETTIRPGDRGYPLTASRDAFQGDAAYAMRELITEVERENASAGRDAEYEIFVPGEGGAVADATSKALQSPEIQQLLEQAGAAASAYLGATWTQHRTQAPPQSAAPAQSPTATPGPLPAPVVAVLRLGGGQVALEALARLRSGEAQPGDKEAVTLALTQATDRANAPDGGGLLQAAEVQRVAHALAPLLELEVKISPFGALGGLLISRTAYDGKKAAAFKRSFGKWLPYLVAWDGTLRMVSQGAKLRVSFRPGFILDDTVNGMTAMERSATGRAIAVVYVHPDTLRSVVEAHRDRPLLVAYWLHSLACHELTHLDGRMGKGHSEQFVVVREEMGRATSGLLLPIAELAARLLGMPLDGIPRVRGVAASPSALLKALERSLSANESLGPGRVRQWFKDNDTLLGVVVASALASAQGTTAPAIASARAAQKKDPEHSAEVLQLQLRADPNPDFAAGTPEATVSLSERWETVRTLAEAADRAMLYIAEHNLGGGNWTGGEVRRGGVPIARISYNGRIWLIGQDDELIPFEQPGAGQK